MAATGEAATRQWDERYRASGEGLVWGAAANRFVVDLVSGVAPGRALDIGAGEGRHALWLAERGWDVTAVDFSQVAMDRTAELAAASGLSVRTEVADVTTWRAEPASFDLVLLAYLQLPADVLAPVLDAAVAAVRAGGRLLLVAHHPDNLEHGHGGPPRADVLTGVEQVTRRLPPGFVVDVAERRRRQVDTPDGPRFALDTVVLATRQAG